MPHQEGHPVEQALVVHDGPHDVLGRVDDLQYVDAGAQAHLVADGGERLDRRVARARAEPSRRTVDLQRSGAHGGHGIADTQAEVLVTVEADLRVVAQFGDERGHAVGDVVHHQGAGRVDDVHALAAACRP